MTEEEVEEKKRLRKAKEFRKNFKGLGQPDINRARCLVNIFTDIVVDSFRLERSSADEEKVLMGWKRF